MRIKKYIIFLILLFIIGSLSSCKSVRGNALGNSRDRDRLNILNYEEAPETEDSSQSFNDGLNKIKQGGGGN